MTPEELNVQMQSLQAEVKAANEKAASLSQELESKNAAIDNLDASVKAQAKTIDELKVMVKASKNTDFKSAFRAALEEKKEELARMMGEKKEKFSVTLEVKTIGDITTANMPTSVVGLQLDSTIHTAPASPFVFIATFGLRPRTGNKLAWLEGASQNGAAYVGELTQNTNKSDVTVTAKTRLFGKLATLMRISTETEDWFEQLFNYCVNEGTRLILDKLDTEILSGNGDDTTNTTHIYGVKGQATAFNALAAGAITAANAADVIFDAADQIKKEGFAANVAFVTWALYRTIRNLKNSGGNYLFDEASGLLDGVRIIPTAKLGTGEILVADTSCVEVVAGNSYELEFIRDGEYDGYDVYFRRAAQVKVPTPKKKGLVYVANVTTAIAALNAA